jgi:hypothetical protein
MHIRINIGLNITLMSLQVITILQRGRLIVEIFDFPLHGWTVNKLIKLKKQTKIVSAHEWNPIVRLVMMAMKTKKLLVFYYMVVKPISLKFTFLRFVTSWYFHRKTFLIFTRTTTPIKIRNTKIRYRNEVILTIHESFKTGLTPNFGQSLSFPFILVHFYIFAITIIFRGRRKLYLTTFV